MRVLVTGSSGFIGRHVVIALRRRGNEVSGLDRSAGEGESGSARGTVCDLLDEASLVGRLQSFRPEALIHLAARTDLAGRTLEDYAANTQGVTNLLSAIRQTPTLRRVLFTSSQLVCRPGYVPAHDSDYCPNTVYGRSKVRTEEIVREGDGGGVDWCLLRPTTVWGPGMSPHYRRFLHMIERGRYVHVGKAPVRKSYGYVGNVVHQYLALLDAAPDQIRGKTLYLADYQPISLRDWADGFQQALGAPQIRTVPRALARAAAWSGDLINALGWRSFPFNTFRLENVMTESVYDLRSTEAICGPLPYGMEAGIEETARWFRQAASSAAGKDTEESKA